MTFYCIADVDTVRGFRLAGVPGTAVSTASETEAALAEASRRADVGIVVLTGTVAARIRPQIEAFRLRRERPLLVEIPGPEGAAPARRNLSQLVHAAVGIRPAPEQGA